jgi:hypothetical protein
MASSKLIDNDTGWDAFKKTLAQLKGTEVVVGIPGEVDFGPSATQAAIGTVHEFGSLDGHTPERSFLRSTFDTNVRKYTDILKKYAASSLKSRKVNRQALFVLGETARGDVINRIRHQEIRQELADSTLVKKKGTTALIEEGALIGSITSTVQDKS